MVLFNSYGTKRQRETKNETDVILTMTDELTGGNVMVPSGNCQMLADEEKQEELLNRWIEERGNAQHDTILTLQSWRLA